MKIALIGPVEPFRSGVAKHSTALARALAATGDRVQVFSFSRQYPALLFPGDAQKDAGAGPPADLDVDYCLDTLWPPSWRATARAVIAARPDAAIIACWTFFTAPALAHIAHALRRAGIPVIAMIHNPGDHEHSRWKQALLSRLIRAADAAIAHSGAVRDAAQAIAPDLRVATYPHPLYDTHPLANTTLPRRARLELLFFGLVRPYKGLDVLFEALELAKCDFALTIAGEVWGDVAALERRIARSPLADRIELLAGYVPDQLAASLFARCDILVAPYRSATGSGVIALAHHYGKPVIASDIDVMRETIEDGRTGWLFSSEDPAALARILDRPDLPEEARRMTESIKELASSRSWVGLADLTRKLAREIG